MAANHLRALSALPPLFPLLPPGAAKTDGISGLEEAEDSLRFLAAARTTGN